MQKKVAIILLGFIMLLTLTACPDKEESTQQEDKDKIPNTMQRASDELEQIITLLGGPLFDGRDNIEQIKNDQIQMLMESIQKTSLGSQNEEQMKPGSGDEEEQQEGGGNEKEEGDKAEEQDGSKEKQDDKGEQSEQQDKQKEKSNDGSEKEKQGKDSESKESGGGQEEKEGTDQSTEKENSGEMQDVQKPEPAHDNKTFQYEDSLFGIPQWHDDNWKIIKILTDGMHFTWNNLQPELIKKGISQTQTENFNKALVALSQNVTTKNIKEAQTAAFQMSQALSEFYSYYKTEIPSELPRITSGVTGIHFSVKQNNWPQAQELANQLQQEFAKLKASIDDNQTHIFQMLELSLNDLCNAVYNQDSVLVMIRTNLVNSNIRELELKLSQNQQ